MKTVTEPGGKPWADRAMPGKAILRKLFSTLLMQKNYILIPAAFLLGRADIAGGLMPFGFAFFAAASGFGAGRLLIAVSVLLGMLTHTSLENIYVTAAGMLLFSVLTLPFRNSKTNMGFKNGLLSFISILTPWFVLAWLQGLLLFDLLRSLFCAFVVFLLYFIFRNFLTITAGPVRKNTYSNEETISVVITAAIIVSGLGAFQLLGFSPRNLICILMIMLFSYRCGPGVGAAAGVSIGLIVSMSSEALPLTVGTYAFCGLLAGIFRNLGKIGSGLGFVMGNAILAIYLGGSNDASIYLKEIAVSLAVFLIIPQRLVDFATGPFRRDNLSAEERRGYSRRIRDIAVERLKKFSGAFSELSKTFEEIAQTKAVAEKNDISLLFDRVAGRVCTDCSLYPHCWERNFYNTYQVMFKIVEVLESKGRLEQGDIPAYFLDRCERLKEFADAVNNMYELFKVDMVWKGRVCESRGMISQQFAGLSSAISCLADEIDTEVDFVGSLEEEIREELANAGIKVKEVMAYENKWGKYEVNVLHSGCGGARVCISAIEKLVSSAVGRRMARETEDCVKARDGSCCVKLVEEENLKVTVSVAKLPRYDSDVSGDSFTFLNDGRGKYIVALSDGMGSGYRASIQSKATVGMLENFIESGFDKDMAVKLINSVLVMKSGDDSFSTIDLSVIDLYNGMAEFVKIGAMPTYIKKEDRVEMVKSASLPAGILAGIDTELSRKSVEAGGMLIMLTDGVADSFTGEEQGDRALLKFIQEIGSINPKQVADCILEEALRRCSGKPGDDMTVIAAKVWKRTR